MGDRVIGDFDDDIFMSLEDEERVVLQASGNIQIIGPNAKIEIISDPPSFVRSHHLSDIAKRPRFVGHGDGKKAVDDALVAARKVRYVEELKKLHENRTPLVEFSGDFTEGYVFPSEPSDHPPVEEWEFRG